MLEKEPSEDALGVSAAFALTHGWANCQGYSDAFYLLAGMAGFEVGFQNGYNAGVLHAWNTVELGGQWYVVDVSTADVAGDLVAPEIGVYTLFNAGRDRCAVLFPGIPSGKPRISRTVRAAVTSFTREFPDLEHAI